MHPHRPLRRHPPGRVRAVLATTVITEILGYTGRSETDINDVILGHASPNGDAPALGQVTALDAGLEVESRAE